MDDSKYGVYRGPVNPRKLRFGTFEVDLRVRELRNRGIRVRLPRKPFQALELLLRKPGSLVSREELMQQLWPNLHVNFEGELNTAINTLRRVLGDSPPYCKFIETLPGLGYRFLMPVEMIGGTEPGTEPIDREGIRRSAVFEAQQDYLKGKYFFNKISEDDLRKSIAYFESAIAQDPSFASAYAALADAYGLSALLSMMPPQDAHRRAKQLIMAARRIDSDLPEVQVSSAGIKTFFEGDWDGAEADYLRAIQTNPRYADGRAAYATLLAITDRVDKALKEIQRAHTLDPLSPIIGAEMASILYLARDFQGAIEHAREALILWPKFAAAQYLLGLAYEAMGMMDEAIAEFQNACLCSDDNPAAVAALGHAYALAGKQPEARRILVELEEMSQSRYVSPYWESLVYVGIEASDRALRSLVLLCYN